MIYLHIVLLTLFTNCNRSSAPDNSFSEKEKCRKEIYSNSFRGSIEGLTDRIPGDRSGKMIVVNGVDIAVKQDQCEYFRYDSISQSIELYVSHYELAKSNYYNFIETQKVRKSLGDQRFSIYKCANSDSLTIFDNHGKECQKILLFE